jgi:GH15 family glucan-1,4-alpha-glucosidase
MNRDSSPPLLRGHGLIGQPGYGALVDHQGTIDWFAPDGIDQPAALFSLLDAAHGGRVQVRFASPSGDGTQTVDEHAAMVTTQTSNGQALLEVRDFLENKRIVRIVTMLRGEADVVLDVVSGDRFGPARRMERWSEGVAFGPLVVRGIEAQTPFTLCAGDRQVITITRNDDRGVTRSGPAAHALTVGEALTKQKRMQHLWKRELANLEIAGAYRNVALTAARSIRILTDPTTGAIQRALTTSLPASVGNERNLDERFAWLRDNAAAVRMWEQLGRPDWADETRNWLHERSSDELPLASTYRLSGERPPSEDEGTLPGWAGNGPVRFGSRNGDHSDLGAIGTLMNVLDDRRSWSQLTRLGDWLADHWHHREAGFYDSRTSKGDRYVESTIQLYFAFDALIATAKRRNPLDLAIIGWSHARQEILSWLSAEGMFGIRPTVGWRRAANDDTSEASLLPLLNRESPRLPEDTEEDPRLRFETTLHQTMAQLSEAVFAHRHLPHVDDGLPPGQGVDLSASFYLVSALCRAQRWEEAHARMETLVPALGPTRIGATHLDQLSGDLRGNLAATPTYLAVIDAARHLAGGPA